MKIETITIMQRKNLGNYEHIEISSSARLEDNEDPSSAILKLKEYIENSLNGIHTIRPASEVTKATEKVKAEPVTEEPKKEKKTRATKEKTIEVKEVAEEIVLNTESFKEKVKAPKKSLAISYDSNIAEHKSIFGGYLSKKYDNSWKKSKPASEIKDFTFSLNGKEFIDSEGHILKSFLDLVHGFFGD